MGQLFVRRTTAVLLAVCGVLTILCVALLVALVLPGCDAATDAKKAKDSVKSDSVDRPITPGPPATKSQETGTNISETWQTNYRLPPTVLPLHYDIYLHPDLETDLFSGNINIYMHSEDKKRSHFLLHSKNLNILTTALYEGHGTQGVRVEIESAFEYNPNEFWVVKLRSPVGSGNFTLRLEFAGNMTGNIVGLYKSVYVDSETGQKRSIATSKFQPTYARRAFPCFDEPSFKSTFTTTLVRPSTDGYIALSNMPVEREYPNQPSPGLTEVKFQKSVPMVTYLACFIVCDFNYTETYTELHHTKFRVFSSPHQVSRTKYALDIGANITDFYEDYFGIEYPLPKQDMIAIPDFLSGAMEHWGIITYRETALLLDDRESSLFNKIRVATVVSHELAHQWFGNLVTLKWWDDLWLNEGFASYIEYKGIANYETKWDMEEQFVTTDLQVVLDIDATLSSHPIIQTVDTPDQITEIFDKISYSKGASVLRMLENSMGDEDFRKGLHNFLFKYKYKNAVTNDLWRELEKTSSKQLNITGIMNTWTRQMGYPVISVRKEHQNYVITQERFLTGTVSNVSKHESPYGYRWEIPLTYISSVSSKPSLIWMHMDEEKITLPKPPGSTWVKFNVGQFGYYRVNYGPDEWKTLSDLLISNPERLRPADRSSLINDAFTLAEAELVPYAVPLDMTRYMKKERHFIPWSSAQDKISYMAAMFMNTHGYHYMRKYVVSLVKDLFQTLTWEDIGSPITRLARVSVVHLACQNGHSPCLTEAGQRLRDWINDPDLYIPPNLRLSTYKYGMNTIGGVEEWEYMWHRYRNESNAQEQMKLLHGLAWTKEPWLLHRYIEYAKREDYIRSQDFFTVISYIAENPVGNPIAWDFIRREWQYLVDRFTVNSRYLGKLPGQVTKHFNTRFQLQQLQQFFQQYPDAGAGERARRQALEQVYNNINWLEKCSEPILKWLKSEDITAVAK